MTRLFTFTAVVALGASVAAAFAPVSNKAIKTAQPAVGSSLFQQTPSTLPRTVMSEMLTQTELPEKLYFPKEKEMPKVLGGLKIGLRKLVVVTGASSGLGLNCAATLAKTGRHFVVMACRDVEKGKRGESAIFSIGCDEKIFVVMKCGDS
jgi:protochlorophyllide reductase